jgi:hypothetical protein
MVPHGTMGYRNSPKNIIYKYSCDKNTTVKNIKHTSTTTNII